MPSCFGRASRCGPELPGAVAARQSPRLVANTCVTAATGTAEWEAAEMLLAGYRRGTVGADKNYDVRRFVRVIRAQGLTPHVAAKRQYSAIDGRTTRHPGYAKSQRRGSWSNRSSGG